VVLVGRDPERCDAAVGTIRRETGNAAVEALQADLSSQAEVRRLADLFLERHDRLHVLLNNAGAMYATRRESVDGIEMTLALNHLAYFLLTHLLLDRLKASAPARIVNVSSNAHGIVKRFHFEDPQARAGYGRSRLADLALVTLAPVAHPAFVQYSQTKLANLLFTYELARRLEGTGVTANALHPGFVATRFMAGNGTLGWFMRRWAGLFAISPEEGAKTSVYLASSPEVEGVSGRYFVKQRPVDSSPASRDAEAARRLWRLSEELTGMTAPVA
jgi:NAD(P)-dependent dehydrogenase (short-subunit alcohol dehydrogenase family)